MFIQDVILIGYSGGKYKFQCYEIPFKPVKGLCVYIPSGYCNNLISHQYFDYSYDLSLIINNIQTKSYSGKSLPNCICILNVSDEQQCECIISDLKNTPYFN